MWNLMENYMLLYEFLEIGVQILHKLLSGGDSCGLL